VDSLISSDSGSIHVVDVWVEKATRLEYRFMLFRRRIHDGGYRLIVHASTPPNTPWDLGLAVLVRSQQGRVDTLRSVGSSGTFVRKEEVFSVAPPFPDTVRVIAVRDR
jgi:hypothetical protein